MTDRFAVGAIIGALAALSVLGYPAVLAFGIGSAVLHRNDRRETAWAGFLTACRFIFYLTFTSAACVAWGIGMLVETAAVGALTVVGILLALGYAYRRKRI